MLAATRPRPLWATLAPLAAGPLRLGLSHRLTRPALTDTASRDSAACCAGVSTLEHRPRHGSQGSRGGGARRTGTAQAGHAAWAAYADTRRRGAAFVNEGFASTSGICLRLGLCPTPSLRSSLWLSLSPSLRPRPRLRLSLRLSLHPSLRPFLRPFLRPSLRPSLSPSLRPSVRPSLRPSQRRQHRLSGPDGPCGHRVPSDVTWQGILTTA